MHLELLSKVWWSGCSQQYQSVPCNPLDNCVSLLVSHGPTYCPVLRLKLLCVKLDIWAEAEASTHTCWVVRWYFRLDILTHDGIFISCNVCIKQHMCRLCLTAMISGWTVELLNVQCWSFCIKKCLKFESNYFHIFVTVCFSEKNVILTYSNATGSKRWTPFTQRLKKHMSS